MDLGITSKVKPLIEAVKLMIEEEILPLESEYFKEVGSTGNRFEYSKKMFEIIEGLKEKAKSRNLWNFWLTDSEKGYGLTTVEYAYLAEEMGKSRLGPEVFNCSAPDTGIMEVLEKYSIGLAHHKVIHLLSIYNGITISELLKKLKVTKQSLNRVLNDLIKKNAIEFKKDLKDTRIKHVFLSNRGLAIFNEIFSIQKKRIYKALLNSSASEVLHFDNVLKRIINE